MEPLKVLEQVHEVAARAASKRPDISSESVSQRIFDDARAESKSFAALPRAKRIAERLRMPWPEVVALAHDSVSKQNMRLGQIDGSGEQDWLTESYIGSILKVMAVRLGVETITPGQYRAERKRMLANDRSRRRHGRQLRIPNEDQIRIALRPTTKSTKGAWETALGLAGLKAEGRRDHHGATTIELLERCYAIYGVQATYKDLQVFARANRIPYSPSTEWAQDVAKWKAKRHAEGLPVPAGFPPLDERPDYGKDVGAALPDEHRRRTRTREECVEAITLYLASLKPGQRSTKRGYSDWSAGHFDRPSASAFDRRGGWEALREEAQAN
jgi:hypothetical protein